MRRTGWIVFIAVVMSFLGGIIGGFLGVGVLDRLLFDSGGFQREIILQESSVIIDVAEQLEPSVVSITSEGEERFDIFGRRFEGPTGSGTGVIISEDGLILTNKHVVPEDSDITVSTSDGMVHKNVRVVDRDPFNDIAYLRLETDAELTPAVLGDSDQIVVGQRVIAIGNALGEFENTVTSGIISGIGRPVVARGAGFETEQLEGLLQTDAAINPGNSGGPLVNIEGQVIGINTAIAGGGENIGFAIPINQVKGGLTSIQKQGRLIKPYLGVRYVMLTSEIADRENLPVNQGAYLAGNGDSSAVLPGSPADTAGLRTGDIITKLGGTEVNSKNSLAMIIGRYQVGERLELTYVRGGDEHTVRVTLQEIPSELN